MAGPLIASSAGTLAQRAFRAPLFIKVWFVPVWIMLGLTKAAVRIISFKRIAPLLGSPAGTACWIPVLTRGQACRARLIARVITLAARYTPWDSNCYPQAFAAVLLLRLYRIPYAFYFGLKRDKESNSFKAHAWAAAGKVRLTGGEGFDEYTVVGCFVSPELGAELQSQLESRS